jgi:hypothetical protein
LRTYKLVVAPRPLPSTPTSEHMQKGLDKTFAWHLSSPSIIDLNQLNSNAPGAPTSLKRGTPTTASTTSDNTLIFFYRCI